MTTTTELQELTTFVSKGGELEMPRGLVVRLLLAHQWFVPFSYSEKEISDALYKEVVYGPPGNTDAMAAQLLLDLGVRKA